MRSGAQSVAVWRRPATIPTEIITSVSFSMVESLNSFNSKSILTVGGKAYTIHRLSAVETVHPQAKKLPYSLKILLENLVRNENGLSVRKADIDALAFWQPKAEPVTEIAYTPARVLMQDFT